MNGRIETALVIGATSDIGRAIAHRLAAIHRRRDVIYVRRVWRPIMFVLRAVPERLFKRMNRL